MRGHALDNIPICTGFKCPNCSIDINRSSEGNDLYLERLYLSDSIESIARHIEVDNDHIWSMCRRDLHGVRRRNPSRNNLELGPRLEDIYHTLKQHRVVIHKGKGDWRHQHLENLMV